ncbi:Na(+)/H(+) antiporter subunit B [Microbulbifer flavimaris]|uniref:Na(+)/H(+) antiporter subunit B n=1 Tax=Microbulbifer flavimaris TaxID=1781068 RepID=A0ABX4I0H4_9GAMM|nr:MULTISPECIES: Na+/H+ antiporter subunit B [Microbulbifer]KUJ83459.1 cation:proton antiporter [Microbulbifer sp. ZGT114]PCO05616.1 Na(+)/H(+) antiporter subunit B [Microbulbifer flavimaris]
MNSVILQTATRALVALILVFSIYMLLRGHNQPGGGFIAGLIAAAGFALFAMAWGIAAARRALRVEPGKLAAIGVLLAGISGAVAALLGQAPFTGQWLFIGATEGDKGLPISTILVFDIGVYLSVLGAVVALVFALEEDA